MKTSGGEAIDEQNIQALQHALCLTPAPLNVNVSARVLPKVMLVFFSSVRANALQATLTLNFGGRGLYRIGRIEEVSIFRQSTVVF